MYLTELIFHTEKTVNDMEAFYGILIPFLGTSLGAACVFFMKKSLSDAVQRSLTGFAAGVMVAASVWSLLIPAIEQSSAMGKLSFLPAFLGFWVGILFLLLLDHVVPHLHAKSGQVEGPKSQLQRTTMMVLAVTLHNIPEGMAVGVVYAGYLSGSAQITAAGALALSLGIAIQNFPEGAIISLPLRAEGMGKARAFWGGVLSGIVEPIGAVLTILAASLIVPALPYLLSFAAGAMLYVVVEELIPGVLRRGLQPDDGARRGAGMKYGRNASRRRYRAVRLLLFMLTPALRLFFHPNKIALIRPLAGEHFVVKILLPVDVGDAVLQFPNTCAQCLLLLRRQDLALRDGALALQAEGEVVLHLLNAHAAFFQAHQAADPRDVPLVKHTAVVFVALDIGDKPLVAVKF